MTNKKKKKRKKIQNSKEDVLKIDNDFLWRSEKKEPWISELTLISYETKKEGERYREWKIRWTDFYVMYLMGMWLFEFFGNAWGFWK